MCPKGVEKALRRTHKLHRQSIVGQWRTDDLDELFVLNVLAVDVRLSAQFVHLLSGQPLSPARENVPQVVDVYQTCSRVFWNPVRSR